MLELGDEDGREAHGEASTEAWQVGDHSSQELSKDILGNSLDLSLIHI